MQLRESDRVIRGVSAVVGSIRDRNEIYVRYVDYTLSTRVIAID